LRRGSHRGAAAWQLNRQAENFSLDFGKTTVDRKTTLAEIGQVSSVFAHVD